MDGLQDIDAGWQLAEGWLHQVRELLEVARGRVVLPDERLRTHDSTHGLLDRLTQRLHAGGRNLADDDVSIPIEHEPGQQVRFAEYPAAVTCSAEPLA